MAFEPVRADLTKQVCVVTGANTGMGKVTAQELARMGATVILACRNVQKGESAKADISKETSNSHLSVEQLDLSSQASVRAFAERVMAKHPKIDVLVNNAGAWGPTREQSIDGIEMQWAANVLGPHLLSQLLLPALDASGHGRIVNVASTAAGGLDLDDATYTRRAYNGVKAYSAAKQANRMLTWALADRLKGRKVVANAVSPGLVATDLNRNATGFFKGLFSMLRLFARDARTGADTAVWLAASPEAGAFNSKFFVDRKEAPCKFRVADQVEKLWNLAETQTKSSGAGTGPSRAAS